MLLISLQFQINNCSMKILQKLRAGVLKFDLFWSTDYLRYKQETEYRTLTGGVCSMIIIVLFIGVFSSSVLSTFNKSTLIWQYGLTQSTSNEFTITTNTHTASKFMFAIGVNGLDLSSSLRYFDFTLSQQIIVNGVPNQLNFSLTPCSRSDWVGAGSKILETFDRLNFSTYLCPPVNQSFAITGMKTSSTSKYIQVTVSECSNSTSSTCVPNTILTDYLLTKPNFNFNIYFVNALINPSNPNEISYYLEDRNYVPFNFAYGGEVNLYMSRYSIVTDQEILPFNTVRTSQGGVVNYVGQYIASRKFGTQFATINIKKSSLSIDIERQYKKLDTTLSYVGGLFGFIIIFFVFMKIYTEYSYEIEMGDTLYYYDKNDPLQSEKFNFFTFLAYAIYQFFNLIGCDVQWNLMKKYQECREQIKQQFDICFLMKRLIFLQRSLRVLFEDHQFKGLHLHQKLTLKQAEQLRSFYKLRDKLQSNCIEQILETDQIERHTTKKSDNSAIMNVTQNVLQNNEQIHQNSYKFQNEYRAVKVTSKSSKISKSNLQKKEKEKSEIQNDSQAMIKPQSSIRHHQQKGELKQQPKNGNTNIKNKLKLLHRQSVQGNKISKKIYEGFSTDIVKDILLQIEQDNEEKEKSDKNEIIVNENQDEFQIRISKRVSKPKKQQEANKSNANSLKIEIQSVQEQENSNKISNEFEYIH